MNRVRINARAFDILQANAIGGRLEVLDRWPNGDVAIEVSDDVLAVLGDDPSAAIIARGGGKAN